MKLALSPISIPEWDGFVAQSPQALLFHTSIWLNLLAEVYECSWHPLGIWIDGQWVGVFPLQLRRLGPFRLAGSPLMQVIASTSFLGPLLSPSLLSAFIPALDDYLQAHKIDHIEIAFPVGVDVPPCQQQGYVFETCQTVLLQLGGHTQTEIWNRLSAACRRAVRKAEANAVMVVDAQDGSFLPVYEQLCEEVYRSADRPPHLGLDFYAGLWQYLFPTGYLKALLAFSRDEMIAGALFLMYKGTAYYLSGASRDDHLAMRPNNLLQWRFIEWALAHHYQLYDLGGAVVPGITHFKLSFGATCYPYTRLYRARTIQARAGRIFYQLAIPWWRRIRKWGLQ